MKESLVMVVVVVVVISTTAQKTLMARTKLLLLNFTLFQIIRKCS